MLDFELKCKVFVIMPKHILKLHKSANFVFDILEAQKMRNSFFYF